mgnify:CR=1 FL=1
MLAGQGAPDEDRRQASTQTRPAREPMREVVFHIGFE